MKYEEIYDVVKAKCPEMLSNESFMNNLCAMVDDCEVACKKKIMKQLTNEEYEAYVKVREVLCTATVGQVIEHLKANFRPTDKLCYMDCIEGYKNDCTYMTKDQLGSRFFRYVKMLDCKDAANEFPYVNENDVVVG